MVSVIAVIATVFVGLAALLHVYIFLMESVRWTKPQTWQRFGVADQNAADITKPMAYNQGFYNLFLAVGAAAGIALFWAGASQVGLSGVAVSSHAQLPLSAVGAMSSAALAGAGHALVLFTAGSMAAAAVVLLTSGKGHLRAALTQGTLPLIGFVLFLLV